MPVHIEKLSTSKDAPAEFARQCILLHFPTPVREYHFAKPRMWRFDVAFPDYKIAVEVEGGMFLPTKGKHAGRHTSPTGIKRDLEKYGEAAVLGWTVLRVLPEQVNNGDAVVLLERLLKARRIL